MDSMLKVLGIELQGHHHSGIAYCRNIVEICRELAKRGWDITIPNRTLDKPYFYELQTAYRRTKQGLIVPSN